MRKFLNLLFVSCLLFVGTSAFANGYCPSKNEFMLKLQTYPDIPYYGTVFNSCVQYFKTTPNPDCERLIILASTLPMLDNQAAGKSKINEVLSILGGQCKIYVDTVKMMID